MVTYSAPKKVDLRAIARSLRNNEWNRVDPFLFRDLCIADKDTTYISQAVKLATHDQIMNAFLYFGRYPDNESDIWITITENMDGDEYINFLKKAMPQITDGWEPVMEHFEVLFIQGEVLPRSFITVVRDAAVRIDSEDILDLLDRNEGVNYTIED